MEKILYAKMRGYNLVVFFKKEKTENPYRVYQEDPLDEKWRRSHFTLIGEYADFYSCVCLLDERARIDREWRTNN